MGLASEQVPSSWSVRWSKVPQLASALLVVNPGRCLAGGSLRLGSDPRHAVVTSSRLGAGAVFVPKIE